MPGTRHSSADQFFSEYTVVLSIIALSYEPQERRHAYGKFSEVRYLIRETFHLDSISGWLWLQRALPHENLYQGGHWLGWNCTAGRVWDHTALTNRGRS